MGAVYEVITGRVANPAAFTALGANTNDTFNVRSFGESALPKLENVWAQQATAGFVRVRSPRMHDSSSAINLVSNAALPQALLPLEAEQRLYQTDTLTFEIQGGGAETDAAALSLYYDNVSSGFARLAMWEQIKNQILNVLTVQVAVAGPVTTGDWSAGNALTTTTDLLHADTWYAVLGYTLDTASLAVAIRGPDTANYRLGGPGVLNSIETRDWFVKMSKAHGTPHIPIIQSQNDTPTQVHVARVGAGGTINVTLVMAELSSGV